ncbi:hypothetical protein MtrunA17_Chr3g0135681 [Medicago truncatula]|uniref:Uncharacterized protein n=1 Tax=Medicago truncatula TaxID=3880 RepID=G7J7M8_MEDTR|nr:hypothetical protein MTR_3g104390 [Medicago truncatula]RHN70453.1 hypothetical protein MtrunA17_Chr3g0135681 [Medicago truncatula]
MEKESATAECTPEALARKLHELLPDSDDEVSEFCFEEETIEKLMQEFYKEIIAFPEQPSTTTPLISKVEEFSPVVDLHSNANANELVEEYKYMEEDEEGDFDDEWLARVLNWSQNIKVGDTSEWF